MERRLAAILVADVVGYSRLMGADEAGTLAALKSARAEVVDPAIDACRGRIVKLMGDGALVEFASVTGAVECAVAIQRGMVAHHADQPEERRIVFRIGVNLGDVIIEGDDIYGDGVNLAARLQALAEPGGICVTGDVYRHVKGNWTLSSTTSADRSSRTPQSQFTSTASDATVPRPRSSRLRQIPYRYLTNLRSPCCHSKA